MNKKDYKNLTIILSLITIYIIFNFINGNSYISQTDYISQHFRISEYLRTLFYSNHNIFPSFALHLGGGQNIYYLAYHGLFSPITILSYLFPFIKMQNFVVFVNILLLYLSIIAFYIWIKPKFETKITCTSTFIFAFSSSLIYHTHRHIMFNNYMLFLILGLLFTDLYFSKNKKSPLMFVTFLIIMTSFYYSILAIITICIYALYKYIKITKKINIKDLIQEAIKFISIMIIPVLISSILLLPTIYAIKNGRSETLSNINLIEVLIPKFTIDNFFYKSYSVGLSCILIYSVINLFINKQIYNKILGIISTIFLIFPFICYALNGFMYIDGKCFIPLLPLFVYIIAIFLQDITTKNYNYKILFTITYITMIIIFFTNLNYKHLFLFIIDNAIIFTSILLYKYKNKYYLLHYPIIIFFIITALFINQNDKMVKLEKIKEINTINENLNINYNKNYRTANLTNLLENTNNILNKDYYTTSIYSSLENKYYTNFVRNIFKNEVFNKDYHTITNSNNILFNMYMANKYLITSNKIIGYEKINNNTYKNDDVFTIGYTNDNLMSKEEFDKLEYPYNIDALMQYTIIDKKIEPVYNNKNIEKYNKEINISKNDIYYTKNNNKYTFNLTNNGNIKLKLNDDVKNKILIITFDMNYNDTIDTSITINNIKNTLAHKNWKYHNNNNTFHYVISNTNELNVEITKGHYEIDNINIYVLDYNNYKNLNNNHDKFNITDTNNSIKGNINVTKNSYFNISIPYDQGFTIKVDNKIIDYELINTSFIGFKLNKGYHNIEITYKPPYAKLGSIISLIGVIIFTIFIWRDINEKN